MLLLWVIGYTVKRGPPLRLDRPTRSVIASRITSICLRLYYYLWPCCHVPWYNRCGKRRRGWIWFCHSFISPSIFLRWETGPGQWFNKVGLAFVLEFFILASIYVLVDDGNRRDRSEALCLDWRKRIIKWAVLLTYADTSTSRAALHSRSACNIINFDTLCWK